MGPRKPAPPSEMHRRVIPPSAVALMVAVLAACAPQRDPEVQEIIDGIRDADARIDTVEIETTTTFKTYRAAAVASGKDTFSINDVYRRSGDDEYYAQNYDDGKRMELAIVGGNATELIAGANNSPTAHRASIDKRISELHSIPLPTRLFISIHDLLTAIDRDRLQRLPDPETIDDHQVAVLEGAWREGGADGTYRLYVDDALGYLPRRVETFWPDGAPRLRRDLQDYREVKPGVWIPFTIVTSEIDSVTHKVSGINRTTVESVRVNEELPDKALYIRLPPGTTFAN